MDETVVIVGPDGTEHEFPPGMDPVRAAEIVRAQGMPSGATEGMLPASSAATGDPEVGPFHKQQPAERMLRGLGNYATEHPIETGVTAGSLMLGMPMAGRVAGALAPGMPAVAQGVTNVGRFLNSPTAAGAIGGIAGLYSGRDPMEKLERGAVGAASGYGAAKVIGGGLEKLGEWMKPKVPAGLARLNEMEIPKPPAGEANPFRTEPPLPPIDPAKRGMMSGNPAAGGKLVTEDINSGVRGSIDDLLNEGGQYRELWSGYSHPPVNEGYTLPPIDDILTAEGNAARLSANEGGRLAPGSARMSVEDLLPQSRVESVELQPSHPTGGEATIPGGDYSVGRTSAKELERIKAPYSPSPKPTPQPSMMEKLGQFSQTAPKPMASHATPTPAAPAQPAAPVMENVGRASSTKGFTMSQGDLQRALDAGIPMEDILSGKAIPQIMELRAQAHKAHYGQAQMNAQARRASERDR